MCFFFNDTATTEIYTLSLHDALPISPSSSAPPAVPATTSPAMDHPTRPPSRPPTTPSPRAARSSCAKAPTSPPPPSRSPRSEEHTSELQSRQYLVCRLLLEKKNNISS